MTEVQALFLILAAIYLLQCVVWLPRDCVAFRGWLRGPWKLARASLSLEALKLRGVLVNPLPPLPGLIACEPASIFLCPKGVAASRPTEASLQQTVAFMSFDEVASIATQEKLLLANDMPFAPFRSPSTARDAARLVGKLAKVSEGKRAQIITAEMQAKFDSTAIADRLARHQDATFLLRFSCNLLFALLFILAPLIVWQRTLAASWPYLLGVLICYMAVITWEFARVHKALYPDGRDQRFSEALTVALSPAGALRANDALLRDLLRDFHPVAVAHALCSTREFEVYASETLRELAFPRSGADQSQAEQARLWWQSAELAALRSFLMKRGISHAQWLGPPAQEPECNSFCPRCWSQFVLREGVCSECGDLALRPFPERAATGAVPAS